MRFHWLVATVFALTLCGGASTAQAPVPEARHALAPIGKLRVGLILTNPMLVTRDSATGELKGGVAVDLAKELAGRLGGPFEAVGYMGSAPLVQAATSGQWDVAFLAIDAARTNVMDFSPPYMEIEAGYLVPAGFLRAEVLVVGNETAVPQSLRSLVKGRRAP